MIQSLLTLTTLGAQRITAAIFSGVPITGTTLAVGQMPADQLTPASFQLGDEVARFPVAANNGEPGTVTFSLTIDAADGPWMLREIGLFDNAGVLLGYGPLPDIYKPTAEEWPNFLAKIFVSITLSASEPIPFPTPGGEPVWTTPNGTKVRLTVNDNLSITPDPITDLPANVTDGEDLIFTTPNGAQVRLTVTNKLTVKPIPL